MLRLRLFPALQRVERLTGDPVRDEGRKA